MKIIDETFFVDTNVLIAATDGGRASHPDALRVIQEVPRLGGHLAWSGQVKREYLVVATRPIERNGLGLDPGLAVENTRQFGCFVDLLDESSSVSRRLEQLVRRYGLKGKRIHDANIVATMMESGLTRLITDDSTDYRAFDTIEAIHPSEFCR